MTTENYELSDLAATEGRNPASERLDELSAIEIVRLMNAEDARVAAAVAGEAPRIAAAIDAIAERLRRGGRLIYIGAGTSGRLGVLDASECPPTFDLAPGQVVGLIAGGPAALTWAAEGAEDRPELAQVDLKAIGLDDRDTVVGIATSGRTPYVIAGLEFARGIGAYTIAISSNYESSVAAASQLAITVVVGPEVLTGSTRLKAGTATKMVLNMLSTGAMVRIGKTYGNLMVDMRATNSKLIGRARRMVSHLTGLDSEQAGRLLESCGGEVKTAVVAGRCAVTPEAARQRLAGAAGRLRGALAETTQQSPPSPGTARPLASTNQLAAGELVLGIDGGGSGTLAILAKRDVAGNEAVLGRGRAGPSNPQVVGFGPAFAAIDEAIAAAFADAGLIQGPVASACLALAGAGRDDDRLELERWAVTSQVAQRFVQVHDALPVLAAGTPDGWGVALVAGTGSLAFGRNHEGRTARSGGWGHLLGDEGSAYAIALDALRAAVQASDGRGPPTLLEDRLMAELHVGRAEQLVPAIYMSGRDRRAIAQLARVVTQAAQEADDVAVRIVQRAADELARMVLAVAQRLGMMERPTPLALAGGVLGATRRLVDQLDSRLREEGLVPQPISFVSEPAFGAVIIARHEWTTTR